MRALPLLVLSGVLAALRPVPAAAEVTVTFLNPEHYTDASLRGGSGERAREPALRAIERDLQQLGARYFKNGQALAVEVLDIDLAGWFEPWHINAGDLRIMREITWPKIRLRYTLRDAAQPPLSAEETVADQMYLSHPEARHSSDPLPYEKVMLEDWFRARFVEHRPPPG